VSRWLRLILLAALLVGLFAWAYNLGNQGTGGSLAELETIGNGVDVAVLTSDPAVSVSTNLTVLPPASWLLSITLTGPQPKGEQVQRGKVLIVLSGGLRLNQDVRDQLTKAGFPVRSYASKQFPWTITPTSTTTIEVPYAGTSETGYVTDLRDLIGDLPPTLVAHTSAGVDMAAPSVGQPYIDCPPKSLHHFCAVSPTDLSGLIDGTNGWHGREAAAPDQSAVLEALPTGNWSIISANPPPKSQGETWTWSDWPEITHRTVIHFASTDQQRSSQRDVLWSGVIFGIVGGVTATWLTSLGTIVRRRPAEERRERLPPPTASAARANGRLSGYSSCWSLGFSSPSGACGANALLQSLPD
jgi:hypothetical protein